MRTHDDRRSRRARRTWRASLTAALTIGALLVGGTAWAYWSSTATGTGTVTTHSVAITQTIFGDLTNVYKNHALTATGSFTVKNTGQVAGNAAIAIETSPGGLAADLPIRVWSVASPAVCTPSTTMPGGAVTGTWASFSLTGGITLAAGQSVVYCVRTTAVSRQSIATASTGTNTSSPTLTVTLDDDEGWVGTATATGINTNTQSTELIYPYPTVGTANYLKAGLSNWFTISRTAGNNVCLDVSNSGGNGSDALSYTCHQNPNQRWEIIPATDQGASLVRLRPKHNAGAASRLAVDGSKVVIQTYSASANAQLWEFQRIAPNQFQLVAHGSGFCLNMTTPSSATALTVSACNLQSTVRANQILSLNREPLSLSAPDGNNNITFDYGSSTGTPTNNATPGYRLQLQNGTNVGNASADDATTLNVAKSNLSEGTNTYRIVISGTSNVLYDNITLTKTTTCSWLGCWAGSTATVTASGGIG